MDQQKIVRSASKFKHSRPPRVGCVLGATSTLSYFVLEGSQSRLGGGRNERSVDKRFSTVLHGLEKGKYYSKLHSILQYYSILQETYIEILQSKIDSSSSRVVILSMGGIFR